MDLDTLRGSGDALFVSDNSLTAVETALESINVHSFEEIAKERDLVIKIVWIIAGASCGFVAVQFFGKLPFLTL